jgi:hypothetical protein
MNSLEFRRRLRNNLVVNYVFNNCEAVRLKIPERTFHVLIITKDSKRPTPKLVRRPREASRFCESNFACGL